MAWWGETSDSGDNWVPDGNPYNTEDTGESGGGPGFLELPTYNMGENTIRFRVRGRQPLTIIIFLNGQQIGSTQHQGHKNRYTITSLPGIGHYQIQLIDTRGRSAMEHATLTC